jgi:hypothetical protein
MFIGGGVPRRELGYGAAAAVGVPVATAGILAGCLALAAYGPGPGMAWTALGALAAFGLLGWCFLNEVITFVPAALTLWALGALLSAFPAAVLEDRGREADCAVLAEDLREEATTTTGADGFTHTTYTTYHDYRLDCPGGGPSHLSTTDDAADAGGVLRVAYDPTGRVDPRPATDAGAHELRLPLILLSAAVVIGVGRTLLYGVDG